MLTLAKLKTLTIYVVHLFFLDNQKGNMYNSHNRTGQG